MAVLAAANMVPVAIEHPEKLDPREETEPAHRLRDRHSFLPRPSGLAQKGITLVLSGVKKQVQEVFDRTGLAPQLGAENIYPTDRIAIDALWVRLGGLGEHATVSE